MVRKKAVTVRRPLPRDTFVQINLHGLIVCQTWSSRGVLWDTRSYQADLRLRANNCEPDFIVVPS